MKARGLIQDAAAIKKVIGVPMAGATARAAVAARYVKEYETSLKNAPMRLRGFYGAAKAAEVSGDVKKAREYFRTSRRPSPTTGRMRRSRAVPTPFDVLA